MPRQPRYVVCLTGASGSIIGVELLKALPGEKHLVCSVDGEKVLTFETGLRVRDLKPWCKGIWKNDNMMAPVASGSFLWDGLVIAPCSMTTMGRLSSGISDNLISRLGAIAFKERRKFVIVPREAPLSKIHLRTMMDVTDAGAILIPAVLTFYTKPKSQDDHVRFIVGRVMDQLGIENDLVVRWGEKKKK
ncbi:MAG TPA: UbiX family flavin prenyltransferase [Thermoplasmata archaeon]|nr:UbiX family flavin prenyltransferase [Thermoplasmata archaeon]